MTSHSAALCTIVVRSEGQTLFNIPMQLPFYPALKDQLTFSFSGTSYFVTVEGRVIHDPGTSEENVVIFCERR